MRKGELGEVHSVSQRLFDQVLICSYEISWNVYGLGSLSNRRFIKEAIRDYGIPFCLLVEKKVVNCSSASLNFLWPGHCVRQVLIDAMGKSGGMILMQDGSIFSAKSIEFSEYWIYIAGQHIKNCLE